MCNEKTYHWYDMEQEILKCWNVVDDLKLLAKQVNNGSDFTATLEGVAELYHYRFERLWESYELALKEKNASNT